MLYERKDLPEIHFLKHFHDDDTDANYVKYDDVILDKTLSPYMYNNDFMNNWLKKMQPLVAILFDKFTMIKNFKNYMVDKYDYRMK